MVVLAASDQRFTQHLLLAVLSASDRSAAAFVRVPVITGSKPFETTSSASTTHAKRQESPFKRFEDKRRAGLFNTGDTTPPPPPLPQQRGKKGRERERERGGGGGRWGEIKRKKKKRREI